MFKRFLPMSVIAALIVIAACTGTPTAARDTEAVQGHGKPSLEEGVGLGSGGWSQQDTGWVTTASADSASGRGGGGAIGSGN
jgi:hypothetical protein